MKGRLFLGLIVVLAGWLAYSNPGMTQFQDFTESHSRDYLEEELGDNAIGRALADAGSSLAGQYIDRIVDRKNYVVFSLFEVGGDIDSESVNAEMSGLRYLGIGGQFIRLGSNE